ncbi:MAG: metallophosphoesterase [Coriobacteriaceae bacterium]|nr:metallophosphoesterase [Coriobacteriaceae bacterium]
MAKRIDIVSDTHGYLDPRLLAAIDGCDLLIHAGDITSESDYAELEASVPAIRAVQGNNDGWYNYGPGVPRLNEFEFEGVRFAVAHFRESLPREGVDVGVCGHTHRAVIDRVDGRMVVNPGSASLPRGGAKPSIARLFVEDGAVLSAEIIKL